MNGNYKFQFSNMGPQGFSVVISFNVNADGEISNDEISIDY